MDQWGSDTVDKDYKALEPKHKIFLSHSGAQKNFVEQLCLDLEAHDRYPFFDIHWNSLPIGVHFPNEIFMAIRCCQVGVLILSKEFFTRTKWPMLELIALVNSKCQNPNLIIMPIFYAITREECCNKKNHTRWLLKWKEWAKIDGRIKIQEWMEALKIFGHTNGISYNNKLGKTKFREKIVQAICQWIPPQTRWDDLHIQGKARLCKVIYQHLQKTQVSPYYGTRIVGLYGMGGTGKTTTCKALCNYLSYEFQNKVCHLEFGNGNEVELLELLHTMLNKLTNIRDEVVTKFNIGECKTQLRKWICKEKIFLAIDNVSDSTKIIEQTKSLLNFDYGEGSIVLVAARSIAILQELLNLSKVDCIEMPELHEDEAKSLFLSQISICPSDIDDKIIKTCMEYCYFRKGCGSDYHYHPLALKVLSVQLGNNPHEWIENLEKSDVFNQFREREHPIFSILRKSFDSLLPEDQQLFMDVVLFYPEDDNYETWTNIFKWLSMLHGKPINVIKNQLNNLKRKSLIEGIDDGSRRLSIHDLWHEFCIIETTREEMKHRRWFYEANFSQFNYYDESSLFNGSWKRLSRICLRGDDNDNKILKVDFSHCSKLEVLKLIKLDIEDTSLVLNHLKSLKSLEIYQTQLPISIQGLGLLKNLVILKLNILSIESYFIEEIGSLTKLQVLELNSKNKKDKMLSIPKLVQLQELMLYGFWDGINTSTLGLSSKMSHIETLNLSGCSSLQYSHGLHELVTLKLLRIKICPLLEELYNLHDLKMLQKLLIQGCKKIKSLNGIGQLIALEKLKLIDCEKLVEIPNLQKLNRLDMLYIKGCTSIKALPSLGDLIALNDLRFQDCTNLIEVPSLRKIQKLQILSIINCKSIKAIVGLEDLISLEELILKSCESLIKVPNLSKLEKLQLLYIEGCKLITSLYGLDNLKVLEELELRYMENLAQLPSLQKMKKLQQLDIEGCKLIKALHGINNSTTLKSLILSGCENLVEISNFQKLKQLQVLYMEGCKSITTLPGLGNLLALDDLRLNGCEKLKSLPNIQKLERLHFFYMEDCKSIRALYGIDNLIGLEHLILDGCFNLEELPNVQKLKKLRFLDMENCKSITKLLGLGDLISLENLTLDGCTNLKELPNLQKLQNLRILNIENCKSIKKIYGVNELQALEDLRFNYCDNLVEIPSLEKLQRLDHIYLEDCKSLKTLPDLGKLTALNDLRIKACDNLHAIPILQNLQRLQVLNIESCKQIKKLSGLGNLISLEYLILDGCQNLIEVPNLKHLENLQLLSMENCKSIMSLIGLGNLKVLKVLSLKGCKSLQEVPTLRKLKRLCLLNMEGCNSITTLSGLGDLISLNDLRLKPCKNLKSIPNVKNLERLEILYIGGCISLEALLGLENLISLKDFRLQSCENLEALPNLQKLQKLHIFHMKKCKLIKTLFGVGDMIELKELVLESCQNLMEVSNLQKLEQLRLLYIQRCKRITTLFGLSNLVNLEDLRLCDCRNLERLPSLQKLNKLCILKIESCKLIKALPGLEGLLALEQLMVDKCVNLTDISCIYELKNLRFLSMIGCNLVTPLINSQKLPVECFFRSWNYDHKRKHDSILNHQQEVMNMLQSSTIDTEDDEIQHEDIYCNSCNILPIVGILYKSKKQPDFDLCQKCFEQWGKIEDYVKIDH